MSKNLAIIGASYLQLPLIERAKELGYTTHVFAWAANDVGEAAADYFYPISIVEKEEILEVCKKIGICGICSIASDLAMLAVNYVANELGLPCNSPRATAKSMNKHLMRKAFEENGDPSPKSILVDADTDLEKLDISYPIIVKPTDRSGSRGIYTLRSPEGLKEAVMASIGQSFEKKALVEEFAEGQEYSVEFISYHGEHHMLVMTFKETTGDPHYIETGHIQPAPVSDEVLQKVNDVLVHALNSLEIENGADCAELKIDDQGNIRLIEIAGRMGGDCFSELVKYSTGYDYVKMVIDVACGNAPDFTQVVEPAPVGVRYVFCQKDVDEFEKLRAEHPERIIRVVDPFQPEKFGGVTDSSNRAGCYLYRP